MDKTLYVHIGGPDVRGNQMAGTFRVATPDEIRAAPEVPDAKDVLRRVGGGLTNHRDILCLPDGQKAEGWTEVGTDVFAAIVAASQAGAAQHEEGRNEHAL
mgnify:CR=1 FL=1